MRNTIMKKKQLKAQQEVLSKLMKEFKVAKEQSNTALFRSGIEICINIVHNKLIDIHNTLVDKTTDQNMDEHF